MAGREMRALLTDRRQMLENDIAQAPWLHVRSSPLPYSCTLHSLLRCSQVRNNEEWLKCWEVVAAEKDRELEVDLMRDPPHKPYTLNLSVLKDGGDKKKSDKKKVSHPRRSS